MYQLKDIKTATLKKIKIRGQKEIVKRTGVRLDLVKAYEEIKQETNNFSVESELAKEADELFDQLLQKNGLKVSPKKEEKSSKLALQEQERKRALDIVRLKLKLSRKK